MYKKIKGIEVFGLPGSGKSFLISSFEKNYRGKIGYFYRHKYYNSFLIKLFTLPIVVLLYRKTIIEIYQNEKTKSPVSRFLIDYFNIFYNSKQIKNHRLFSKIYIIFTAGFDKILLFFLRLLNIAFIMDEGVYQKAIGLILRDPSIDTEVLINDFFLSKNNSSTDIVIYPHSLNKHYEMIKNRKRKDVAISKWINSDFTYDDILKNCTRFLDQLIDEKANKVIKIENTYSQGSIESFHKILVNMFNKNKILIIN